MAVSGVVYNLCRVPDVVSLEMVSREIRSTRNVRTNAMTDGRLTSSPLNFTPPKAYC